MSWLPEEMASARPAESFGESAFSKKRFLSLLCQYLVR